ncbi:MAG: division/cell wall cluster transcriptional repressor MraZ [Candidatus Eiseniibacteriota bacterium]
MASFRGSFRHSVDGKGRLALPKTFRRIVGVKEKAGPEPVLIFTQGFNGCVGVYTEDEWPAYERRLRDRPFEDQQTRDFALELAKVTMDVPVDTVGRVLIPQIHMDLGGLEKNGDVLVLGMFDHIELWNPARYDKQLERIKGSFEERAKGFFEKDRSPRSAG